MCQRSDAVDVRNSKALHETPLALASDSQTIRMKKESNTNNLSYSANGHTSRNCSLFSSLRIAFSLAAKTNQRKTYMHSRHQRLFTGQFKVFHQKDGMFSSESCHRNHVFMPSKSCDRNHVIMSCRRPVKLSITIKDLLRFLILKRLSPHQPSVLRMNRIQANVQCYNVEI